VEINHRSHDHVRDLPVFFGGSSSFAGRYLLLAAIEVVLVYGVKKSLVGNGRLDKLVCNGARDGFSLFLCPFSEVTLPGELGLFLQLPAVSDRIERSVFVLLGFPACCGL
jgi:hypothetical protein